MELSGPIAIPVGFVNVPKDVPVPAIFVVLP